MLRDNISDKQSKTILDFASRKPTHIDKREPIVHNTEAYWREWLHKSSLGFI